MPFTPRGTANQRQRARTARSHRRRHGRRLPVPAPHQRQGRTAPGARQQWQGMQGTGTSTDHPQRRGPRGSQATGQTATQPEACLEPPSPQCGLLRRLPSRPRYRHTPNIRSHPVTAQTTLEGNWSSKLCCARNTDIPQRYTKSVHHRHNHRVQNHHAERQTRASKVL